MKDNEMGALFRVFNEHPSYNYGDIWARFMNDRTLSAYETVEIIPAQVSLILNVAPHKCYTIGKAYLLQRRYLITLNAEHFESTLRNECMPCIIVSLSCVQYP